MASDISIEPSLFVSTDPRQRASSPRKRNTRIAIASEMSIVPSSLASAADEWYNKIKETSIEKFMQSQKSMDNQTINKKYSLLSKLHFIIGIIVFLFWLCVFILLSVFEEPGSSDGLGFLIIIPFIYANTLLFIISLAISISIFSSNKIKKEKVLNIISTVLISTILIVLYPVNFFKENVYDIYFKTAKSCEKNKNENLQNYCYLDLARKRHDITICTNIVDESYKDACYDASAKNPSDCLLIKSDSEKNFCLSQFKK